jgi:hypothetical protein
VEDPLIPNLKPGCVPSGWPQRAAQTWQAVCLPPTSNPSPRQNASRASASGTDPHGLIPLGPTGYSIRSRPVKLWRHSNGQLVLPLLHQGPRRHFNPTSQVVRLLERRPAPGGWPWTLAGSAVRVTSTRPSGHVGMLPMLASSTTMFPLSIARPSLLPCVLPLPCLHNSSTLSHPCLLCTVSPSSFPPFAFALRLPSDLSNLNSLPPLSPDHWTDSISTQKLDFLPLSLPAAAFLPSVLNSYLRRARVSLLPFTC